VRRNDVIFSFRGFIKNETLYPARRSDQKWLGKTAHIAHPKLSVRTALREVTDFVAKLLGSDYNDEFAIGSLW